MLSLALFVSISLAQDLDAVDVADGATDDAEEVADVDASAPKAADAASTAGSVVTDAAADTPSDWPYLSEVQAWWLDHGEALIEGEGGLRERGEALGLPRNTVFLVHAPTGQLLAPAPSSVREADPVQVVLLSPAWVSSDFSMDPQSCAKPSRFDVSSESALALSVDVQGGLASQDLGSKTDFAEEDLYRANFVGQHMACGAGSLSYALEVAHPGAEGVAITTSEVDLSVRDTTSLAAIVVPGWDFGSRSEAWIDASGSEDGSQGTVALDTDVALGPGLYAGAMWMIGGVDYADLRWYNVFANPFLAVGVNGLVDATGSVGSGTVRVTSPSYLVGTAITPTGGLSLAIGASIRPELNLRGWSEGDAVPLPQELGLNYESTWEGARPSLFIGVAVDNKLYTVLQKTLGQGD